MMMVVILFLSFSFYLAEITLALEHLHSNGIIYRYIIILRRRRLVEYFIGMCQVMGVNWIIVFWSGNDFSFHLVCLDKKPQPQ